MSSGGQRSTGGREVTLTSMVMLEFDVLTAAHLAVAIKRHLEAEQRQHRVPLPALVQLCSMVASRAREGHAGSTLDVVDQASEAAAMAPHLLTYEQVAQQLSCSDSTVKRLVRSGELPTVRVGGLVRVRTTDLNSYVAELAPRHDSLIGATG